MSYFLTNAAAFTAIASLIVGFTGFLVDAAFGGYAALRFGEVCMRTCAVGLLVTMALGIAAWAVN